MHWSCASISVHSSYLAWSHYMASKKVSCVPSSHKSATNSTNTYWITDVRLPEKKNNLRVTIVTTPFSQSLLIIFFKGRLPSGHEKRVRFPNGILILHNPSTPCLILLTPGTWTIFDDSSHKNLTMGFCSQNWVYKTHCLSFYIKLGRCTFEHLQTSFLISSRTLR